MAGSTTPRGFSQPNSRSIRRRAPIWGLLVGVVLIVGLAGVYLTFAPSGPAAVAAPPAAPGAAATSHEFTIHGEVRRPGRYSSLPSDTAAGLVLRAGGLTPAARDRVKVVRKVPGKGNVTILVNLRDVLSKGMPEKDVSLIPGDVLVVEERLMKL